MKESLVFLLAPDSFKESMTAQEACQAMKDGIKKVDGKIEFISIPMADGGEGTTQSLVNATDGRIYYEKVLDPLGNSVKAGYGILGDGNTAVIEVASASGLHLIPNEYRNPLITHTYGTGQLIKAALDKGITKLIIGLGGSGTNDAGIGMITALGGEFYTSDGLIKNYGGGSLRNITRINLENLDSRLDNLEIEIASDVQNPLCGPNGASYIFGPQKGATPEMVEILDDGLKHYGTLLSEISGRDISNVPGSGAAGGIGASLNSILKGKIKSGVELIMKYSNIEEQVKRADIVWTGEGCTDIQTKFGKVVLGVARMAKKFNKPVIVLSGKVEGDMDYLYHEGVQSIFSISQGEANLAELLTNAKQNMSKTSENIARLINLNRK